MKTLDKIDSTADTDNTTEIRINQLWDRYYVKILSDFSQEARYIVQCLNKTYSKVHKEYGAGVFNAPFCTSIKVMEHGD